MRFALVFWMLLGVFDDQLVASQPRGTAAAGQRPRACAILSRDLVQKFDTGNPKTLTLFEPEEEPVGAAGSSCQDGSIHFQLNPFARSDELRKSPGKDWRAVTGVGDTAFSRNNANTYAELMVWTGSQHFTLQVSVPPGGSVDSISPKVTELARAILAKLR